MKGFTRFLLLFSIFFVGIPSQAENFPSFPFIAGKIQFDLGRHLVIALNPTGKTVAFLHLDTGEIQTIPLSLSPLSLAATPDRHWLYISETPTLDFRPSDQAGKIAEIDLTTLSLTQELQLDFNPYDVAPTDNRFIVISDYAYTDSPQAKILNAKTGKITDSTSIYQLSPITLHPNQGSVFGQSLGMLNGYLARAFLDTQAGTFRSFEQIRYTGDLGEFSQLVVDPDGQRIVTTPFGFVYQLSSFPAKDMLNIGQLERNAQALAFDPAHANSLVAIEDGAIAFYRKDTWAAYQRVFTDTPLPAYLAVETNTVYFSTIRETNTVIRSLTNAAIGMEVDIPPQARLEASSEGPIRNEKVTLQATGSSDPDQTSGLLYRWDLNGDGLFDTDFSNESSISTSFRHAGTNKVRVEVRDRFGLSATADLNLIIGFSPQKAEAAPGNTPGQITFPINAGCFAPGQPFFYFLRPESNLVARINLTNGLVDKQWTLQTSPNTLAFTPDGSRLFIGMSTNSATEYLSGTLGWIAELDPSTESIINEFPTTLDPYEMAATSTGFVLTYGPKFGLELHSYAATNGAFRSQANIDNYTDGMLTSLALTPSGDAIYGATSDPGGILGFHFDPIEGTFGFKKSVGNQAYGFVSPLLNGTNLLSGGGGLFRMSLNPAFDLTKLKDLGQWPVSALLQLPELDVNVLLVPQAFLIAPGSLVYYHDSFDQPFLTQPISYDTRFIGSYSGRIYEIGVLATNTVLRSRLVPSLSPEQNLAPSLAVTGAPPSNVLTFGSTLTLDVASEDLDGKVASLEFLVNDTLQEEQSLPPFRFKWTPTNAGSYSLVLRSTDNLGAKITTNLLLTVNIPPRITLDPSTNQLLSPALLRLQAYPVDDDGTIESITFYAQGFGNRYLRNWTLGALYHPPWILSVPDFVGNGVFVTAVVRDNLGGTNSVTIPINSLGAAGDDFDRGYSLTGTYATALADNSQATTQIREFGIAETYQSLWWVWTAPSNGVTWISTAGSSFDTVLSVGTGSTFAKSRSLADNDDSPFAAPASLVKFNAVAGTLYHIRVASAVENETGAVRLTLFEKPFPNPVPPPANDSFTNQIVLQGSNLVVFGSNRGATAEVSEPRHAASLPKASVWWSWTSPSDGMTTISTAGSDFDTTLSVYAQADSLSSIHAITENDDFGGTNSTVQFSAIANTTYIIAVDGAAGDQGQINLAISVDETNPLNPPANDNFAARLLLAGSSVFFSGVNTNATREDAEPALTNVAGRSLWWTWTAPDTGPVYISGFGWPAIPHFPQSSEIRIGVFRGTNLLNLNLVGSSTRLRTTSVGYKSALQFNALAGETYSILVDSPLSGPPFAYFNVALTELPTLPSLKFLDFNRPILPGQIDFQIQSSHHSLRLELSSDLVHWQSWTNIPEPGTNLLTLPIRPGDAPQFLRALTFE